MRSFNIVFVALTLTFGTGKGSPIIGEPLVCRNEEHRLQLHFSVPEHWMNDPNGMYYYNGTYHLFYQYYPNATVWGPMHWGHASSTDLVTWTDLPIALYPDELGLIFSGSSVVDFRNVSGLQRDPGQPAVLAFFTHADGAYPQMQSLAYSVDGGRNFIKYQNNPVVPNPGVRDFRDPKVVPYGDGQWVMNVAVGDRIQFFGSSNLINWTYLSEFGQNEGAHGGVWECPDLLQFQVGNRTLWVLLVSINPGGPNGGSVTQYFVGNFDGRVFTTNQTEVLWMDWGLDNYAGVTFFNDPKGRANLMGWMNNWDYANEVPTGTYRGQMTLPRILTLVEVSAGQFRLKSTLAEEFAKLRTPNEEFKLEPRELQPNFYWKVSEEIGFGKALQEVDLEFDISGIQGTSSIAICFVNDLTQEVCTGYDHGRTKDQEIFLNRERSGNVGFSGRFHTRPTAGRYINSTNLRIHAVLDVSGIEVFVDDGLTALTALFYPDEVFKNLEIRHHASNSTSRVQFLGGRVQGLNSIYDC